MVCPRCVVLCVEVISNAQRVIRKKKEGNKIILNVFISVIILITVTPPFIRFVPAQYIHDLSVFFVVFVCFSCRTCARGSSTPFHVCGILLLRLTTEFRFF